MPNENPYRMLRAAFLWPTLLLGFNFAPAGSAYGQITLSYGAIDADVVADNNNQDLLARSYVELGYDLPLSQSLTLTPSVGLLNKQSSSVTILTDPSGYKLGLWGQYDLLNYGAGNAYAQSGVTYLDYTSDSLETSPITDQLQFALGVGADVDLGRNVSAFTNLNYIFSREASSELPSLGTPETGLEIGIEIAF